MESSPRRSRINSFRLLVHRLLALTRTRRLDRELDDEILAHLELAERDALAAGLSPEEARRAARRQFGGIDQMKEVHRDKRSVRWIDTLLRDVRYGLGSLRRDPGFTVVAIGVLALGIGANTAMFSLVDAVLLKPLPFPEPERIVRLWEAPSPTSRNSTTTLTFLDWKRLNRSFEAMSVEREVSAALATGDGDPVRLSGTLVSSDYFTVFGVSALVGRTFSPQEDQPGAPAVVVLSHALWQGRFGGDPSILQREILLDGEPHRVVGVLPPGSFDRSPAVFWKPLIFSPAQMTRGAHWLSVVGRLRPGVSLEPARADMRAVYAGLASELPQWKRKDGWTVAVDPFDELLVHPIFRRTLHVAFGAVVLVLLIACANVANLLLAKGATRRQEMAVRAALGASRGRLVSQLLTESLVLCLLGAAAGVLLAWTLIHATVPLMQSLLPFTADVGLDLRVLGFALAVAVAVSVGIGLLPSLQTSSGSLLPGLGQSTRGSSIAYRRLRRVLVVTEVAVSLVLLCGALLLFRSLIKLQHVDPGVRLMNVVTMAIDLPQQAYPTPERATQVFDALIARVQAAPGVESASIAQDVPLEPVSGGEGLQVPGHEDFTLVRFKRVDPHYFSTLDIPVVTGRGITDRDRAGTPPVIVINQELARQLSQRFGMTNPVGQTVTLSTPDYTLTKGGMKQVQIVGMIRNESVQDLRAPMSSVAYVPLAQVPRREIKLIVRTRGEPVTAMTAIREALKQVDRTLALADVKTMTEVKEQQLSRTSHPTWTIGAFAATAALLAALGLYGVLAHTVTQQRREIGIRMALGARVGHVLSHVLASALTLVGIGLALGLAGAAALTSVMKSLLFEVSPLDPIALILACAAMTAVGLLAAVVPASRAADVDPMTVLREG